MNSSQAVYVISLYRPTQTNPLLSVAGFRRTEVVKEAGLRADELHQDLLKRDENYVYDIRTEGIDSIEGNRILGDNLSAQNLREIHQLRLTVIHH